MKALSLTKSPLCDRPAPSTVFVGVPVKLGARGAEQVIEIKLTAEEDAALQKSAAAVRELVGMFGV